MVVVVVVVVVGGGSGVKTKMINFLVKRRAKRTIFCSSLILSTCRIISGQKTLNVHYL